MKEVKKVKNIYVCKTIKKYPNDINTILVEYEDGTNTYVDVPFFYSMLDEVKRLKIQKELLEKFNDFIDSSVNVIEINNDTDISLKNGIDDKIVDIKIANGHDFILTVLPGTFSFSMAMGNISKIFRVSKKLPLCSQCLTSASLFNTFFSFSSLFFFSQVIKDIKKNKNIQLKNTFITNLKLYFSYFMIISNLTVNTLNIGFNCDEIVAGIKTYVIKEKQSNLDLDNPFSDDDYNGIINYDITDKLINALQFNPLLEEEYLKIALSLENYLESNPYLDYEEVYNDFSNLAIIDLNITNKTKNGNYIDGSYVDDDNLIYLYNSSYENDFINEMVVQHELVHVTGSLDNIMLNEGMTSLICAEFFDSGVVYNAYSDHVLITKIFCELITPQKMLEAYSKKDTTIIYAELSKLNLDTEDINKLMDSMQEYGKEFRKNGESSINDINNCLLKILKSDKLSLEQLMMIEQYMKYFGTGNSEYDKFYFLNNNKVSSKQKIKD